MMLFVMGVCLGSFFCVFAERMPIRQNFWSTRSQCPHCKQTLRFYELIPIVSFLSLKGRCLRCHTKIPLIYFIAECLYGFVFYIICCYPSLFGFPLSTLLTWMTSAFILSMIDIFYYEVDTWLLYTTTILLWINLYLVHAHFNWISAGCFLLLYHLSKRWSFIGEADLFLAFSWFPWLTFTQMFYLLWSASILGIVYYVYCMYILKKHHIMIPFIPFLSLGLLLTSLLQY